MKVQDKHLFVIKIILIITFTIICIWLYQKNLFFSAILSFLVTIGLGRSLFLDRQRLLRKIDKMITSIQYNDFSYKFSERKSENEIDELHHKINKALAIFRIHSQNSVLDEAEAKAWQKLISVLTHEIMNSIAPIISLSETLGTHKDSNTISQTQYNTMVQAMEIIHRRSKGLLNFIENYRKLTRIPEPSLQPIHLKSMLKALQQLVASDKITFSYSTYPENLTVNADRNLLEQMLINLLKNAYEASPTNDTKIFVKAEKIGIETHISVIDNGLGINNEAIEKIFVPFYSTKKNGSGIGLSLCKQIMFRHKGKITVESSQKGSIFTLIFK